MLYSSMNLVLSSPLEQFEVVNFISISAPILGYLNISLTNLGLYSILVLFLVLSLHILGNNENKLVPSYLSLPLESSYASVHSMVKSQIVVANEQYIPFIY